MTLAGVDLDELVHDVEALGLSKVGQRSALRLETET
jgi:hypothetical protein